MTKKNTTPADFQPIETAAAVKKPRRRRNAAAADLPAADLPAADLPAADLPAAELPAAELPAAAAELPAAELPAAAADLPAAELPPPPDVITLPDFSPLPDAYYNNVVPTHSEEAPLTPADFLEESTPTRTDGGGSAAANAAKEELEELYQELEQRLRLGLPFNYVVLMNHWSRPEAKTLESFKKRFIEAYEKTYDATPLEVLLGKDRGKTNKALLGMSTAKSVDAFSRSINSLRRARNDGAEGAEDLLSKRLEQELLQAIEERKTALKSLREFARVWRPAKELRERIKAASLTTLVDDDLLTDARALQRRATTSDLLRLVRIQLERLNALD